MAKHRSSTSRSTHWTEADARRVLSDWQRSGDTLEAFARARGLVPQRLGWWKKRLGISRGAARPPLTLVPAAVISVDRSAAVDHAVTIRLPHGIVIELDGASPTWIAALARELARSAS